MISLDTETERFGPHNMAPRLVVVSTAQRESDEVVSYLTHRLNFFHDYAEWMLKQPLVGHAIEYDMVVLCRHFNDPDLTARVFAAYEAETIHCTLVREQIKDIAYGQLRGPYTLEHLASAYLGKTLDKDTWRLRYGELIDVPLSEWEQGARDYAAEDAVSTLELYEAQERTLADRGDSWIMENAPLRAAYAFQLRLMCVWGMITDAERVARYAAYLESDVVRLRKELVGAGLMTEKTRGRGKDKVGTGEFKRETKRIKALLVEALGDDVKYTEKGNVSTDRETLSQFEDDESYGVLASVAKYVSLEHMKSTYLPVLQEGTRGPIHSSFHMLLTGRYGASKNMQTLPREGPIRPCYRAREGYVLLANDYDVAELRAWAQVMVDMFGVDRVPMAQLFRADPNADPHTKFGAEVLLGISYEEGLALKKAGDKGMKAARQAAKAYNFGLPGGLGAEKFCLLAKKAYGVDITLDEAKERIKQWKTAWNAWDYYRYMDEKIRDFGYVVQHRSNRVRGGVGYTDGCNTMFQGLTADGTYYAAFELARLMYSVRDSVLFGSRVLDVTHDEVITEVPEETAHECAVDVQRVMNERMQVLLPDVPVTSSPSLMTRWVKEPPKEFKAVVDGRHQVYEVPLDYGYPERKAA